MITSPLQSHFTGFHCATIDMFPASDWFMIGLKRSRHNQEQVPETPTSRKAANNLRGNSGFRRKFGVKEEIL